MKIYRITAMWCMSCLAMKRVWKKVFKDFNEIEIIDLDFDFDEAEVKKFNVGKILPLLIVYKDNQEITRITGEKTVKQMLEILEVINAKN